MLAMSYFKVEGPCAAEGSVPFGRALLGWCPRRRSAARLRSRPHSSAAPVDQRCPTGHFYRVLARSRLLSEPSGVAPALEALTRRQLDRSLRCLERMVRHKP